MEGFGMGPERGEGDEKEEGLRPTLLDEFIGQRKTKENLKVFIGAARERAEALDHVFLMGPPGLGKTTLAGIMAREMGSEMRVTAAPALEKPKDLAGILTTLGERAVFFIDEIHRLKPAIEEMLYVAMEDFELDWIIGQGPAARTIRIPLPKFTLVGATTRAGMVSSPLVTRFGITVRLEYYGPEDLALIVSRTARLLGVGIDDEAVGLLARASRGTPRIANRLVKRMRDFAQMAGRASIDAGIVASGMDRLEIDPYGLERQDREILRTIARKFSGGPVGAETLAIAVGESVESLEDYYEPYLIQVGFLVRTPRGRMVSEEGLRHIGMGGSARNGQEGLLF
jgi:Holliday junction DNA helicase RuvB